MTSTLELRFSPSATGKVAGWFLPGNNVAGWLDELARCGLSGDDVRLFVVPMSLHDLRAAGLLVLPPDNFKPPHAPAGLPLTRFGERLLAPADAILHPPISEIEARELCRWSVTFFHPTLGLSGFDNDSTLHVWDLLQAPIERAENWNHARVASNWPAPFRGIVVAQSPTVETMFGEESRDIGSEASELLPPAPDELSGNPLSKAGQEAKRRLALTLAKMISHVPHTGTQRTWLNDVEDWARRHAQAVAANLDKARNKELHRLLHLLRTDPDAGLRHAIPFNNFAHRGRGPAGGRLGEHGVDFSLGGLGGGAADFWDVPSDLQEQLIQNYRELADREMRLGRHRRAAYIYAELLGDLTSAANALKQGGHFREAALLYEERLHNPLAAAECFAGAGLLREAIERYEKLERFLDAADLYLRLGENAKAEAAVRRVIQDKLDAGDSLEAAKLFEQRLHLPDEAARVLRESWPHSRQALQSLDALFDLFARHNSHDAAARRVAELGTDEFARDRAEKIASILAQTAAKYPEARVRFAATDLARVFVAQDLSRARIGSNDAMRLVQILASLAPQDRLLARDGSRFVSKLRERELQRQRAQPPPRAGSCAPTLVRRIELPRQIKWFALRSTGRFFFAAGLSRSRLTVARGIWDGDIQTVSWPYELHRPPEGVIFEPVQSPSSELIVARAGADGFKRQTFPATDLFFSSACTAGTPAWLPRELFPVAVNETSVWAIHVAAGQAVLSCYGFNGQLFSTTDVTDGLLNNATRTEATHLSIAANRTGAAVALGDRLFLPHSSSALQIQLPGQVTRLISTLPHTRAGTVALLEHGAVLHWYDTSDLIELDRDLRCRDAAWTRSGKLVLLADDELRILDVDSRGVHAVQRMPLKEKDGEGVVTGGEPREFAVLSSNGQVTVFRTD